jgi:uncharacterized membrane protein YkoI
MKTKNIIKSLLMLAIAAVLSLGSGRAYAADTAAASDPAALEAKAKVSKADALKTALAKVPGTVNNSGIVQKNGAILWTFDIAPTGGKGVTVVSVDATTGKIASVTAGKGGKGKDDDEDEKDDD